MDASKSRGRGRLFACFRPFDGDTISNSPSFISLGVDGSKKKRSLRRSFSSAIKAVIFRTVLLKKSRSENRHEQDTNGWRSNNSSSRGKSKDGIFRKNSNRSPLFSSESSTRTPSISSLSASSESSPSRFESENIQRCLSIDHLRHAMKQKTINGRKCVNNNYNIPALEVCVLLVCLASLIWGKAFAVVACTSAWLFFSPAATGGGRTRRLGQVDSYEYYGGGDSEDYKKRVIMEGLLERDRSRVLQYSLIHSNSRGGEN